MLKLKKNNSGAKGLISSFSYRLGVNTHQCIKKCTLVQAMRLCTGRTAHRWSRGIALLFLDHGTRRGEGSTSRPGRSLPPGKTRYPLCRRLGGPKDRSGHVRKISSPTGVRFPDRPARSQSLHQLSYPAHTPMYTISLIRTCSYIPNAVKSDINSASLNAET